MRDTMSLHWFSDGVNALADSILWIGEHKTGALVLYHTAAEFLSLARGQNFNLKLAW